MDTNLSNRGISHSVIDRGFAPDSAAFSIIFPIALINDLFGFEPDFTAESAAFSMIFPIALINDLGFEPDFRAAFAAACPSGNPDPCSNDFTMSPKNDLG